VRDWLRASISSRVSGELLLLGDVEIALDAAFFGRPGVLVMAGTGSNVAGRSCQGTLTTAGGWGPALADQGSGHRIGSEALRALFLAKDEGRPTQLLEAVLEFWQLDSLELLIEYANRQPAPDFSRLTEVVVRCAERGDQVAAAVLQREGEDLGYLVRLVLRRLEAASTGSGRSWQAALPALAFTGSILEKVAPVRAALIAAVHAEFPEVAMREGVIDPIAGAVWRARTGGLATLEFCN
jgi:glucosamine kinase